MFCLIGAESAIFVIFVVAYLFYVGKSPSGPTPAILHAPIFFSICLLSSSWTIHRAVLALKRGEVGSFAGFGSPRWSSERCSSPARDWSGGTSSWTKA